jgi:hypothetical protein
LVSLPKQVLWDILDRVDVCNNLDQPFDLLKTALLRQFAKSKWQSYFGLLRLPLEMQGLNPTILMGKLKQHLPHGVSPDTDLFLSMFLIRLPPSMREAVRAGNHKTAAAMVTAVNALWDAHRGNDPSVAATMTQCSRSPAPEGKKNDTRGGGACSKSRPPSFQDFFHFLNHPKASVSTTTITAQGPTTVFPLVPGQKTEKPLSLYRLSGGTYTCHGHGHAFHRQRWLDFSHQQIDK